MISLLADSHLPTPCAIAGIAQPRNTRLLIAVGMAPNIIAAIMISSEMMTRPRPITVDRYPLWHFSRSAIISPDCGGSILPFSKSEIALRLLPQRVQNFTLPSICEAQLGQYIETSAEKEFTAVFSLIQLRAGCEGNEIQRITLVLTGPRAEHRTNHRKALSSGHIHLFIEEV